ncbi:MAG: DNA cytosine methyltransferase [Clostridium sp.]|uniref:DNA cytosine methyltransferase n=1 Tax=Clostridium TaxID=1485 RepID=UPI001C1DE6F3|nr:MULTISPECIES: DNA cytosine methyltransferase [Clostridium]MBS5926995.1 DNA cytosine methyltransferase [Clostridium sp.]MBU6134534.1 DNA cytosine methyltransferase [Clostridium tertium]
MYAIDLFCGAGGMSEGIIQAGFHILFSSDINEDVERTYTNRHAQLGYIDGYNTHFQRTDVRELTGDYIMNCINNLGMFTNGENELPEDIDAIFGGPPCQGFSRAGRRDPNDPRNMLFKEYLRIINEIQPKYVVMENVEGLNDTKFYDFIGITGNIYNDEDGVLVPTILQNELNLIGYNVLEPRVLDASDYGVPQRRRRAIFIAYRNDQKAPEYPIPTHTDENKVTVNDAISDLVGEIDLNIENLTQYQLDSKIGRTLRVDGTHLPFQEIPNNMELSTHSDIIIERFSLFNEGEDSSSLRKRILTEGINIKDKHSLLELLEESTNLDRNTLIHTFANGNVPVDLVTILLTKKNIRRRLCRNNPSLTVVTLPDDYISPFENRTFSVREMARLQSFDDSFVFLGKRTTGGSRRKVEVPQYTQVGNAVPPLLARAIALEIRRALEN